MSRIAQFINICILNYYLNDEKTTTIEYFTLSTELRFSDAIVEYIAGDSFEVVCIVFI